MVVVIRPGVIEEEESGWEKGIRGTFCRVSKFVVSLEYKLVGSIVVGSLTTIKICTLHTYQ